MYTNHVLSSYGQISYIGIRLSSLTTMPQKPSNGAKHSPISKLQHLTQPYVRGNRPPPLNTPQTFAPFKRPKTQLDE